MYTEHFVARIFLIRTVCQAVLSGSHPSLTFHALAWLKMKQRAFSKTVHTSRNTSYVTPEMTSTLSPCTRTLSYPILRHDLPQLLRLFILARSIPATIQHFCADEGTIETVFRTIISVNQLSIFGAVSDVCEEYSTCQTRTVRPVLPGQSDPFFEPATLLIMTPRPSIEIPAQEILLQLNKERVERLPQQDRVIKICTDA